MREKLMVPRRTKISMKAGKNPPESGELPAIWRHALALAGPAVGLHALVLLVNLFGRWLAGNAETATAADQLALQGAQTTCFYLAWMIGSFGILASAGATALVARLVGAGDRDGANRAMHQAVLVAVAVGVAGWLLGAFGVDGLLALLNLDGTAAGYARQFLRAMLLLLPFQLLATTLNASLAGAGDTRTPLTIAVGTTAANLPLSWIGFRGLGEWPGLGLAGIAWGAGISQALGTVVLLVLLARGRSGLRLELSLFCCTSVCRRRPKAWRWWPARWSFCRLSIGWAMPPAGPTASPWAGSRSLKCSASPSVSPPVCWWARTWGPAGPTRPAAGVSSPMPAAAH
ncbi:MAG: hypothetical protein EBZ13_01075 [Planctomycetia bacterium]|nr:hypothetical protein [Planctomycetia bacterium]